MSVERIPPRIRGGFFGVLVYWTMRLMQEVQMEQWWQPAVWAFCGVMVVLIAAVILRVRVA